jgi:outer membrane lipoprotein SlyB
MSRLAPALLLLPALAFSAGGCMTTRTTQRMTYDDARGWERPGRVEWVRETVTRTEGNPAGGAVAGALIGGLFGSALGGHTSYDRWGRAYHHGSGVGALFGAAAGAAVGAAASQGSAEDRSYEVLVRFNDGASRVFLYRGPPPFRAGEEVLLTGRGLVPFGPLSSG